MTLLLMAALIMDECFGEIKRGHPLVVFGNYALFLERILYPTALDAKPIKKLAAGFVCWCLSVLPIVLFTVALMWLVDGYCSDLIFWIVNAVVLYFTVGQKSLKQHAHAVSVPLMQSEKKQSENNKAEKLAEARFALSMIVSRDTGQATPQQISTATIETVTENTHDAVIGPMVFFILFGAPGAVLFRLSNTLDAMWGYRNERYEWFGKFSARADDVLGFMPARITAMLMAMTAPLNFINALKSIWFTGRAWYSPNAGLVMAAGAGALNIILGGNAVYDGKLKDRLSLGFGHAVKAGDVTRSIALMYKTSVLLIVIVAVLEYCFDFSFRSVGPVL